MPTHNTKSLQRATSLVLWIANTCNAYEKQDDLGSPNYLELAGLIACRKSVKIIKFTGKVSECIGITYHTHKKVSIKVGAMEIGDDMTMSPLIEMFATLNSLSRAIYLWLDNPSTYDRCSSRVDGVDFDMLKFLGVKKGE